MKSSLIVLSIIAIFLLVATSFKPTGHVPGDTIPDFRLKDVSGKMVSLSDFKSAKGFIIIFTSNHCAYSMIYQQRIIDLNNNYEPKGYPVIAINSEDTTIFYPKPVLQFTGGTLTNMAFDSAQGGFLDTYVNMMKVAAENHYPFPYLFDGNQAVAREFGATKTPEVFILQKESKDLKLRYLGAIDDNAEDINSIHHHYAEDAINALLANQPVPVAETKTIGCMIVWKN